MPKAICEIIYKAFNKYVKEAKIPGKMKALEETPEAIIEEMNNKSVFIALSDNVPVGTIRVEIKPDNTAFISRFGVSPEYQKNGIGRALIKFVDDHLIKKGVTKVCLYTASKHRDLVRFYYSMNFYIDSTTKDRGYIRALLVKEY